MILSVSLAATDEPAALAEPAGPVAGPRRSLAGLRWGAFVTLFLAAQLGLAVAAVRCAYSDGGARSLAGAEEEVVRSDARPTPSAGPAVRGDRR